MVITEPVYFVTVKGNFKDVASRMERTIIATYESHIDITYIVSEADEIDISSYVLAYYKSMGKRLKKKDVSVTHSKEGINFIQLTLN